MNARLASKLSFYKYIYQYNVWFVYYSKEQTKLVLLFLGSLFFPSFLTHFE